MAFPCPEVYQFVQFLLNVISHDLQIKITSQCNLHFSSYSKLCKNNRNFSVTLFQWSKKQLPWTCTSLPKKKQFIFLHLDSVLSSLECNIDFIPVIWIASSIGINTKHYYQILQLLPSARLSSDCTQLLPGYFFIPFTFIDDLRLFASLQLPKRWDKLDAST